MKEFLSKYLKNEPVIREYVLQGKMLRPKAFIASYHACGGKDMPLDIAAAIELLHNSYLMLDDIIDEDEKRRGKMTLHIQLQTRFPGHDKPTSIFSSERARYGASKAALLSNVTRILAYRLIIPYQEALQLFIEADMATHKGQIMDLEMEYEKPSEPKYLEMIRLKTAELFGCAFELGAVMAGAGDRKELRQMGIDAAMSFQINDDLLDLKEKKGRPIGSDIRKGKKTLLVIKALEKDKTVHKILGNPQASEEEIKEAIKTFQKTGAVEYCKKLAGENARKAEATAKKYDMLFVKLLTNPV